MLALTKVRGSGWFYPGAKTSFFLVLFLVAVSVIRPLVKLISHWVLKLCNKVTI